VLLPPITENNELDSFNYQVAKTLADLSPAPVYNVGTGVITNPVTRGVLGYLYRYLHIRFADDNIGTGFGTALEGKAFVGLYNTELSADPATEIHTNYNWYKLADLPTETTGLFYKNLGNRSLNYVFADTAPDFRWTQFLVVDTENPAEEEVTETVSPLDPWPPGSPPPTGIVESSVVTTETGTSVDFTEVTTVTTTTITNYDNWTLTVRVTTGIVLTRLAIGYIDLDDLNPTLGIGTDLIKEGSVTTSKIAEGAVSSSKLADRSVIEPKLADNAVSNRAVQTNAISTNKIANGAVTLPKIAASGVPSHNTYLRGDGTWAIIEETDPVFTYDIDGNVTRIDFESGHYKTITYDSNGIPLQLDYVVGTLTKRRTFNYNIDGVITSITDTEIV
jgi:hypothetical protein